MGDKPSRLSEQGKESQWVEIQDNDSVQLGADFEADGGTLAFFSSKETVLMMTHFAAMHRCVYFRINLPRAGSTPAPPYSGSPGVVGSAPSDVGDYSDGSYVYESQQKQNQTKKMSDMANTSTKTFVPQGLCQ